MINIFANRSSDLTEVGRYWVAVYPVDTNGAFIDSGDIAGFRSMWGFGQKDKQPTFSSASPLSPPGEKSFPTTEAAFLAAVKAIEKKAAEDANADVIVCVV